MFDDTRERKAPQSITVRVLSGDIAKVEADALITGINSGGMWFGGIDRVIQREAGDHFHQQARAQTLEDGRAIVARGPHTSDASFKNVVFVVDDLSKPLHQIIHAGLTAANDAGFSKVSLPTMRMGVMRSATGQTQAETTRDMVQGIREFIQATPQPNLREISIVVYNDPHTAELLRTACAQLEQSTVGEEISLSSREALNERRAVRERELAQAGFSPEQVEEIAKRSPHLDVVVLVPEAGERITTSAADAVALTEITGSTVVIHFNRHLVIVSPGNTLDEVVKTYQDAVQAAHDAYWTPERIAQDEASKSSMTSAIERELQALPEFFKEWVVACGDKNYSRELNISIAKDAHLLASTLASPAALGAWFKLSYAEQMNAVPGLRQDHSAFSFHQVAHLAMQYLEVTAK
jgi:O-acetyl-ADP-ribose deacetylase (regulator of RNase III)